jgi:CheY-like chemotaxis protein
VACFGNGHGLTCLASPVQTHVAPPVVPSSAKEQELLAGRKLLLADDSVTIQKVIDLTFADEGVEVITVGDGAVAVEKIEQTMPDVVLADVFMPGFNGYEVCEYIKGSEKLKHIPVMLLVGSFEPFDEVEARRVGADDILTKPFQSIRRLIEKVGDLVSGKPPQAEVDTAELPKPAPPEAHKLSTAELEVTTADTLQLPEHMAHQAHQFATEQAAAKLSTDRPTARRAVSENKMDFEQAKKNSFADQAETPLDLDDFGAAEIVAAEDFELELETDESEASAPAFSSAGYSGGSSRSSWEKSSDVAVMDTEVAVAEPASDTSRYQMPVKEAFAAEARSSRTQLTDDDLSPEMIDRIARRAVEMLSEKVVQEIAWEVVPQLAELLIKRRLEETQPK